MKELGDDAVRDLLARVARHDNAALSVLYEHYKRYVYAVLQGELRNPDDADEALNDTFLVVAQKPENFDYTSVFSSWLIGIARNKAKDIQRKRGRRSQREVSMTEWDGDVSIPSGLFESVQAEERRTLIQECIRELPVPQREALLLQLGTDASMEQIAEALDCPLGTAKTRLMHARRNISACVRRKAGFDQ